MAQGKKILSPYVLSNAQDISANFTSNPTSTERLDRVCMEILCTGAPIGTVTVQASVDYVPSTEDPDNAVPPLSSPTWFDLPLSLTALTGAPQNYFIDITVTAIRFLRVNFVAGIGSVGNMTIVLSAKES